MIEKGELISARMASEREPIFIFPFDEYIHISPRVDAVDYHRQSVVTKHKQIL